MKKLMTATLMALIFVGATIADYDANDHNRNAVLHMLADRGESHIDNGETNNGVNTVSAGYRIHFSEYYQLNDELLY